MSKRAIIFRLMKSFLPFRNLFVDQTKPFVVSSDNIRLGSGITYANELYHKIHSDKKMSITNTNGTVSSNILGIIGHRFSKPMCSM